MYKLHVVAGPTASGKSDFARKLATEINGELVNADSRQIYRYLDIGTNKDPEPIQLTSFLEPDQRFSMYQYAEKVAELLPQIWDAGRTPILVGGTGLYINIILHPEMYLQPPYELPEVDFERFTERLGDGGWEDASRQELQAILGEFVPQALAQMNDSDRQNPRRLTALLNRIMNPIAGSGAEKLAEMMQTYQPEIVKHYIDLPDEELESRIEARVERMFEKGLVDEVKSVLERGYPVSSVGLQGIGYREVLDFVDGKIDLETANLQIQESHKQYARRQRTWFKKYFR